MDIPFKNRRDAGRHLARELEHYRHTPGLLILALPRGGVPVAFEVAISLQAPLHVFTVRKLGVPGHEEYAMGAIASGGISYLNQEIVRTLRIPRSAVDDVIAREKRELERRERLYEGDFKLADLSAKTVILIDDGLATGASMRAAVGALSQKHPRRLVVAVPVAAASTCEELRDMVDEVVCAMAPEPFYAVGNWYEDFTQTTDAEVRELLDRAKHLSPAGVIQF